MNRPLLALLGAAAFTLAGCQLSLPKKATSNASYPLPATDVGVGSAGPVIAPPVRVDPEPTAETVSPDPAVIPAAHEEPADLTSGGIQPEEPLSSPESSAETSLTLDQLEGIALANNPSIAEAAAAVQALHGRYMQAGLPNNPTAGYVASEIGNEGEGGQQGIFFGQEFIRGNKLGLSQAVVAQEIRRAQQQLEAATLRTQTDVRLGHFELLVAQRREEIARQLAENSGRGLNAVTALAEAQEASGVELLQAEIEVQTAEALVQNAQTNVEGAWRRLAAVLGDPSLPRARVAGELDDARPLAEYETIVARTIEASPQVAAAYAEVDRSRWAIERARAEGVPNVTAQGQLQYDFASDDAIAGVQVGLPLPVYNWNQGGVQEAVGEYRVAQQAARRVELSLERQLAQSYQDYVGARQRVDRYASEVLPRAQRSLDLTRSGYSNGEFTFLELLTAQRTYYQTNLVYLDSLSEMGATSRRMNGLLLSDSLQIAP